MRRSYSAFEPSHHSVFEGRVRVATSLTHFSAMLVALMDNPRVVEVRRGPVLRLSVAERAVSNFLRAVEFLAVGGVLASPRVRAPRGRPLPHDRAVPGPRPRPDGGARPLGGMVSGRRRRPRRRARGSRARRELALSAAARR